MKKIILLMYFWALISYANVPRSSVAAGSGGGGVATVQAGEASFMNPATIPHLRGRYFYTSFQKDLFAVSLTENDKGSIVPGAVSYFSDREVQMFSLSFADFIYRNITFGGSLTYWQAQFESDRATPEKRITAFNANVGMMWIPFSNFGVGFAAENIADAPEEYVENNRLTPTSRIGANYIYKDWFRWRLDFVTLKDNRWDNWIPQTGFESYLGKWFIVRTGVSRPPGLKESWSAGFGFDLPRFKVDYASQWHVNGGNEHLHYVDLAVPF